MTIKITDKVLSIPPYISSNWARIAALHMKGGLLVITLVDGSTLQIPNLTTETIHSIFQHHTAYLEQEPAVSTQTSAESLASLGSDTTHYKELKAEKEPSIHLAFGSSIDGLSNMMMQHNPKQADAPDLPPEILQKVSAIAKIIAPLEDVIVPQAEANCNCFHCQIARALHADDSSSAQFSPDEEHEEPVKEEELQFQQWSINQTGEKLFLVENRLDANESYHVYLGEPVGCTCGKTGCEHILAVLKS